MKNMTAIKPKHLAYSAIGFTIGYLISTTIEGTVGWHPYLAGLIGNSIAFVLLYMIL